MTENNKKVMVLIDSNAIIHRAYHALPKTMKTSKGELTNVVYGYTTTLIKVLEDLKPTHIAASFDISKATFRAAEFAEYKAHRVKADQELYDQIPRVRELLEVLNIPVYEMEGFEADDCIGTIAAKFQLTDNKYQIDAELQIPDKEDFEVYIVTGDKDAFQLIDGNIFVYNLKGGLQNGEVIGREQIKRDWDLHPEDFIDLKALAGDPSDNIPGVPGIGPKTAIDLLQRFDSLKGLYEQLEAQVAKFEGQGDVESIEKSVANNLSLKPRIVGLLTQYKEQAFMSQMLATIRRDVPLGFELDKCIWGEYDREKVKEFFTKMQFLSLLRRFGALPSEEKRTKEAEEQSKRDDQLQLL
jgi:DNA polymerase-1